MEELVGERKRRFKAAIYGAVADLALALANPRRLELLDFLAQRERDVPSLSRETSVDPATLSEDLRILVEAGVVERRHAGATETYRVADEAMMDAWIALRSAAAAHGAGARVMQEFLGGRESLSLPQVTELTGRVERGEVFLLDVRPTEEYAAGHLPGARSARLEDLDAVLAGLPPGAEVVAYCRGPFCTWADAAVVRLRRRGFRAHHMAEGVGEWRRRGVEAEVGPPLSTARRGPVPKGP